MTEPADEQPPLPTVARVIDQDGVEHYASRHAKFVVDGLAEGSLREVDDAPVPTPSEDHNTGTPDESAGDGSGDGQRTPDTTDDSGAASEPRTETSRRSGKRN